MVKKLDLNHQLMRMHFAVWSSSSLCLFTPLNGKSSLMSLLILMTLYWSWHDTPIKGGCWFFCIFVLAEISNFKLNILILTNHVTIGLIKTSVGEEARAFWGERLLVSSVRGKSGCQGKVMKIGSDYWKPLVQGVSHMGATSWQELIM